MDRGPRLLGSGRKKNFQRYVTALIGWQRSHHCHPALTRQKRCFYKGQLLT